MTTEITELDSIQRVNAELLRVLRRITEMHEAPLSGKYDTFSRRACDMSALAKTAVAFAVFHSKSTR